MPAITIRQAQATDAAMVQEMLDEAARWVDAMGVVMWEEGELVPGRVDGRLPPDCSSSRTWTTILRAW